MRGALRRSSPQARSTVTRNLRGLAKPHPPVIGMEVDLIAAFVNHDLMMEPAEQDNPVLVGLAPF